MKVGILCEFSGIVRSAFIKRGHDAVSCDLLAAEDGGPHLQGDCLTFDWSGFDLLICHPPCTYLCSSGLHWNKRVPERAAKTAEALEFVRKLLALPVPRIALENPVGCISSQIRKPDQTIQPWQFGHPESKGTCLWLKGLPCLIPTWIVPGEYVCPECKNRFPESMGKYGCLNGCVKPAKIVWQNQTPSGQNKLGPSPDRWKLRSLTYTGIAEAMADQWGSLA